ncbi:hypothetical protein [Corynebacterium silvaticum]|uniref:Uncharacterized protein n=1 Tax=Corynebacterium silvaticum TaxID=2320431 RepID=A0A7Y4UPG7_9CORY|nr:hypothetical protein [Corynebacterium silvaticum]ARU45290.1 hypothetical protein CBE74_00795 [Corynebacterium silvaticum]MBH5301121.1 hypothetical protein [Corynebacterium silvaticum]NOM65321.1 hypothetical protein [Corynebacterium silvaticum]NON70959.1 hypothetical protein [Corynebacterium silvaticum]TFA92670.1 hypothetical protein EU802_04755 [Corynebacterium silvaticum]
MQQKKVPFISGIVVALIASRALRSTTDWNEFSVIAVSIAIAFVVSAIIVFIGGALGTLDENPSKEEERS